MFLIHLVSKDFSFCIVFEMPVSFVSAFDQLAELNGEGLMVEEVMNSKARSGCLAGVRGANTLLGSPNTAPKTIIVYSSRRKKEAHTLIYQARPL